MCVSLKMYIVPPHIRALIFDCDGTLVDSISSHTGAWNEALNSYGLSLAEGELLRHSGIPTREIMRNLAREHSWQINPDEFARLKDHHYQQRRSQLTEIQETAEIVREYYGKLPMAVLSGGSRENVEHALHTTGLLHYFPLILTASDNLPSKASPEIFFEIARRLGVEPHQCLVFEDGVVAIESAQAAGMSTVHVDSLRNR